VVACGTIDLKSKFRRRRTGFRGVPGQCWRGQL